LKFDSAAAADENRCTFFSCDSSLFPPPRPPSSAGILKISSGASAFCRSTIRDAARREFCRFSYWASRSLCASAAPSTFAATASFRFSKGAAFHGAPASRVRSRAKRATRFLFPAPPTFLAARGPPPPPPPDFLGWNPACSRKRFSPRDCAVLLADRVGLSSPASSSFRRMRRRAKSFALPCSCCCCCCCCCCPARLPCRPLSGVCCCTKASLVRATNSSRNHVRLAIRSLDVI
jgi:hypothetical protein